MITAKEISALLPRKTQKLIFDPEYILPTDRAVVEAVDEWFLNRTKPGYSHLYDCDNFAMELMVAMSGRGWAFGVAIIPDHAVNFYINEDKEVKYIEPQGGSHLPGVDRLYIVVMI